MSNIGDSSSPVLVLQNDIIEAQRQIIGELVKLYCTEPVFELPEELQEKIREANSMYRELNTP